MHRLASIPGDWSPDEVALFEQPSAPVLFLTSASSDITTLDTSLRLERNACWKNRIRAIDLKEFQHPAQIDHYIATTAINASLVIVRLIGGKSHWSYGLEQLQQWQEAKSNRHLIILAGTKEEFIALNSISTVEMEIVNKLAEYLIVGGVENICNFLEVIHNIINDNKFQINNYSIKIINDPERWDWKEDNGRKVLIINYKAFYQSGDTLFAQSINDEFRRNKLCPRSVWVSSLRNKTVQQILLELIKQEKIEAIVCTTSFSCSGSYELDDKNSFLEEIDVPIFQAITCSTTKEEWLKSYRGLTPLDLSLQVVMPELDGRVTTIPCTFKATSKISNLLYSKIEFHEPDRKAIEWIGKLVKNWVELKYIEVNEKKLTIVLANNPIKNGRIANGVGLDTPESTVKVLSWLKQTGYYLGEKALPRNGSELMKMLITNRTNDEESYYKESLDFLSLNKYNAYFANIPSIARKKVVGKWGKPTNKITANGFSINGIRFGNVSIIIQPPRGTDANSLVELHSPELPPNHSYIANYIWIEHIQKSNIIIHMGKHGSIEWLPGKSVGLSEHCFPLIVMPPIPHIYPFIVNDPGEGSQAKRRTHAIIIDHLTPPLGRAELHGDLLSLESLFDEYFEAKMLYQDRANVITKQIINKLKEISWPNLDLKVLTKDSFAIDSYLHEVESYLCEIKESQIRIGLHIFGKKPKKQNLKQLLLSIARAPTINYKGITQVVAEVLKLDLDPWKDEEGTRLNNNDLAIITKYLDSNKKPRILGNIVPFIESQSLIIINELLKHELPISKKDISYELIEPLRILLSNTNIDPTIKRIKSSIIPKLNNCSINEKKSFIKAVNGQRVISGPSGAPTRGRVDVLPTGRNFYSLDLRGLPTEAAWDLGRRTAEQITDLYLLENGNHLKKLAISVWGTSTMRNGGEDICQLLSLIGVRPVWDEANRRLIGLEVIPLSILERPRVDVTLRISGLFRDAFPQLISLVNNAQGMVARLNEAEEMNPYSHSAKINGITSRVFGSAPGCYGTGLQELIDSGNWNNIEDIAKTYLEWSQWSYEEYSEPVKNYKSLEGALKDVQVVIHNQDNREHDILDSDDYYQFHGGIYSAVKSLSKQEPKILFSDTSRPQRPKIHNLTKELDKVVRSRVTNPKWIEAMKKHGYKGAFEMSASLDYLFSYDATTNKVEDWCYTAIYKSWIESDNTREFIKQSNPWALRDIAERLLESYNRKMWEEATDKQLEKLKVIINNTESDIEKNII